MLIALTREVSESIQDCQLTHLPRESINLTRAQEQHRQYEKCLTELGCELQRLPSEPELPDAVFVEDTAIVLDQIGIITRPGASSRQAETLSVAKILETYRDLRYIKPPGTLDGGDILLIGKVIYAGRSSRSNLEGIEQLRSYISPYGYTIEILPIENSLHLKSAVTRVAENTLLINPDWIDASAFEHFELIEIDREEPFGANALLVNNCVLYPQAYHKTLKRLEGYSLEVVLVDVSELAKAEGGVTCCSLIFQG